MSPPLAVGIVGGLGFLGRHVLRALQAQPDRFALTLLNRTTSNALCPPEVRVISADWSNENGLQAILPVLQGLDVLVSLVGGNVATGLDPILLKAAIEAKVKLFVASEYSLDVTHPSVREIGKGTLLRQRLECANELRRLSEGSDTYCLSISVGAFLDSGLENGFLGFNLSSATATLFDRGVHKTTGSTLAFVGRAVRSIIQMPLAGPKYQRVQVAEVEYSGQDLLQLFEQYTGRPWTRVYVSTEELKAKGDDAARRGDLRAAYVNYVLMLNYNGCGAVHLLEGLRFEEFNIERESLQSIVERISRTVPS